ncbi:MAG: ATP-dependent acyl-CoA ligase [Lautropia sp.]
MLELPITERTFGHALSEQARRQGDRPFLMFDGRRYSYADALLQSRRLAGALRGIGIAKGDHVAVLMDNHPNMVWTLFALGLLGSVAVPVNAAARGDLLGYFLGHSRSTALIVDRTLLPTVAAVLDRAPAIRRVIVHAGEPAAGEPTAATPAETAPAAADGRAWHSLDALLDGFDGELPADAARFTDVQLVMYTSGTTGPSKGALCTHAQEQTGGLFMAQQLRYTPDDVLYTGLPLFHANALRVTLTAALWSGASVALARRFSASNFWADIRRYGATEFNALGAMANILMQAPPSAQDADHRLRICNIVPALPDDKRVAFEHRFKAKVTSLYGSTEMCCPVFATEGTPPSKWPTCGRIVPPFEMRVVDDDDLELPAGRIGEWLIRASEPWYAFQGYLDMPAETAAAWRNGWFHTGDRGYVDADGYWYFVDRKKEAVRRRGENISSYEVELSICAHPAVLEAAVVPVAAELGEDDVMVFVVLREGARLTELDLVRFCEERMAAFMVPRFVRFIERLPKTPSEKVEKYQLKRIAEAQRAELWDRERVLGRTRRR